MRLKARSANQIVLLLGVGTAIALFADLAIYVVLPTHTADAGILLVDVGIMLSANRLIRIFLNGPYGVLIERLPRRPVLLLSQCFGILSALMYVISGFWPLLAGRLLWGLAWSGIWLAGNTLVLDVATQANRGRLVGRYQMWSFAGFVGGALLGGTFTDLFGFHATFLIFMATSFGALVGWWLLLPETRPAVVPQPTTPDPALVQLPTHNARTPLITATLIMGVNWLIFLGIIGATLALLLQERVGTALSLGLVLLPLSTVTGVVAAGKDFVSLLAAPFSGMLSDHLGNRWLVIVVTLGLGSGALLLIALGNGGLTLLGLLLGAVTTSVLQTQATALVGDYSSDNRQGRRLGVLNVVGDIGIAPGPLLAFFLIGQDWSLQTIYLLAAGLLTALIPWTAWVTFHSAKKLQIA
jgi:MFS family permease